jgi:hypothetical protein
MVKREGEMRYYSTYTHTHISHEKQAHTARLTRTRKPSAAVRLSAAEKGGSGSLSMAIQHSTLARTTGPRIPPTAMQHAHAAKRKRQRLRTVYEGLLLNSAQPRRPAQRAPVFIIYNIVFAGDDRIPSE